MRIAFITTEVQEEQIKKLPRNVNMSEELRKCLDKILAKHQPFAKSLTKNGEVK